MSKQSLLATAEVALLDCDGSCRDLNFSEEIPTSGAVGVLDFLASSWRLNQAITGNGEGIAFAELAHYLEQASGSLSTLWDHGSNPRHIQAYFYWNNIGRIFCEITFFPQDFDKASFTSDGFLMMLRKLIDAAQSQEYYLRFENASWRHGEPMKSADVILSHVTFPLAMS